jgi:2-(acetamidomethylene)succinate hydrolase
MEDTYFETSSIRLHGTRVGRGPLVVYLHGITANWAVWQPILEGMSAETTGVAISQRGHGQSDKPASEYGSKGFVADTLALIESVGLGPAIIVGHSLGARNAVVAGAERPDLVRGVLSVDFVPQVERAALDTLKDRVLKGDRSFESLDDAKAYLAERYKLIPPDAIARRAENGFVEIDGKWRPRAIAASVAQTSDGLYEDYHQAYQNIKVPTIAVRGEKSTLISAEAFAKAAGMRPDIEHITVEGVDHYVPEEDPATTMRLLRKLISAAGH